MTLWMPLLPAIPIPPVSRDLEQAAEHIAANALYQIEVNHVDKVEYTREMVEELLK